jgi:hypothetical protein
MMQVRIAQAGVWELSLTSVVAQPVNALAISWAVTGLIPTTPSPPPPPPPPPPSKSWWTTGHIITVAVFGGVAVIILLVLIGVAIYYCRRNRQYEAV